MHAFSPQWCQREAVSRPGRCTKAMGTQSVAVDEDVDRSTRPSRRERRQQRALGMNAYPALYDGRSEHSLIGRCFTERAQSWVSRGSE